MNYMKKTITKTWKDCTTDRVHRKMKQHKYLRFPLAIYLRFVTTVYDLGWYFMHNGKRFSCVGAVFLFSIASSSFAYPTDTQIVELTGESLEELEGIQESYEYTPIELDIDEVEIIDDDDVLEGYDNEELDVQDEIDQFSLDDILAANEVTGSEDDEVKGTLSKDDWQLVLVNKQHPVPEDYPLNLGTITGNMQCDARIIDDLMEMMQAAKDDGIDLVICSPYRDYNRQTVLFNRKIDYYMNKGYSYTEAYKISSITVTVPGASEHQIGLALDIVSTEYSALEIEFGETEAGIWLKEHSYEYGFILRYPEGKEYITGIQYEPWHFRYVGEEAATIIMQEGITLEEFLEDLE